MKKTLYVIICQGRILTTFLLKGVGSMDSGPERISLNNDDAATRIMGSHIFY